MQRGHNASDCLLNIGAHRFRINSQHAIPKPSQLAVEFKPQPRAPILRKFDSNSFNWVTVTIPFSASACRLNSIP